VCLITEEDEDEAARNLATDPTACLFIQATFMANIAVPCAGRQGSRLLIATASHHKASPWPARALAAVVWPDSVRCHEFNVGSRPSTYHSAVSQCCTTVLNIKLSISRAWRCNVGFGRCSRPVEKSASAWQALSGSGLWSLESRM
jgi:hypothetical protein